MYLKDGEICQCEHVCHEPTPKDGSSWKRSPNGNPGHHYGAEYSATYMVDVKTEYGTFHVCKDCAEDCMASVRI